jgi:hypothetical protein
MSEMALIRSTRSTRLAWNVVFLSCFLHLLLVCIFVEPHKIVYSCRSFRRFTIRLSTWLLIAGSYAAATGQKGVPEASSAPYCKAGFFSSVEQCEVDKSPQASPQPLQSLLTAKTVFILGEPLVSATSKAEETLKKAFVKWGRFQVVDDPETADLIIIIWEFSSSKPGKMERIRDSMAIFVGGTTPSTEGTPLWTVTEVGPVLGQRPTGKLVEDLRKQLTKLEESLRDSAAPPPTGRGVKRVPVSKKDL